MRCVAVTYVNTANAVTSFRFVDDLPQSRMTVWLSDDSRELAVRWPTTPSFGHCWLRYRSIVSFTLGWDGGVE